MKLSDAKIMFDANFDRHTASLMTQQYDTVVCCLDSKETDKSIMIWHFQNHKMTNEGVYFWGELQKLYSNHEPTLEEVKKVYKKQGIPYPSN